MRVTWANLRASSALWLVLPALIFTGVYIDGATYTVPSGYGVQAGELAAQGVVAIATAVAAAGAWEAGRHRLLGALGRTGRRGAVRQFIRAAVPVVFLMIVLVSGAVVVAEREADALPSGIGWLAVAHLLVISCGWLLIGWSLGVLLPRSVAAPLAAVGCWAWLTMPHAMSAPWIRHLGGFIDGESTVTDVLTPAVYLVPWSVVAGSALAFWLLARMRPRGAAVIIALVVLTATVVAGRAAVIGWGYSNPMEPRDVSLSCVGRAPTVCVPPEYEPYAAQLRRDALHPLERLEAAGVAAPRELRVTSEKKPLKPGMWPLTWSLPLRGSERDSTDYVIRLAESAVSGTAELAGVHDCRQQGSLAAAWATLVAGVDEQTVRAAMLPPDWAVIEKVRNLPIEEQNEWFTREVVGQKHCVKGVS
ncbi:MULTISPECIES: hypothetical protein [unclassified Streptomyces]|uniref:DUF7224 domain-containing protein n=1 Tax=unclassified Streptomyces TaxID=2593676 RepID=UPI0038177FF2